MFDETDDTANPFASEPSQSTFASRIGDDRATETTPSTVEPPAPHPTHEPTPSTSTARVSPARPQAPKLRDEVKDPILITDAQKTSEGASSSYIVYVIRSEHGEARRRYSEFEALRVVLGKLYPVLIIPPIPPHHSIGDYASKQSKAKEDASVIARRRRMLAVFLNRLNRHPLLSRDRVFIRFLDPTTPWAEIIHAPPVTHLPKNPLRAPTQNPTDTSLGHLYSVLPLPGTGQALQDPDQRFLDSEAFTNKFSAQLSGSTEKVNKRIMRRWTDFGADHADMGALLNGFGLTETDQQLAAAIERTGQAVDSTYVNTNAMLQEWERTFTEPLNEYGQFSSIIKGLLKYRHNKHLQYETIRDVLEAKRASLEELERTEQEARRLDSALDRATARAAAASALSARDEFPAAPNSNASGSPRQPETSESVADHSSPPSDDGVTSTPPPSARRSGTGSGSLGLIGAIQHSIHNMIDVDPESTRRSNIGKTREQIGQLDEGLRLASGDLRYASQTIQADLDRFQRQKVSDFRDMFLALCQTHKEWCQKNLETWEEAKREIAKLSDPEA